MANDHVDGIVMVDLRSGDPRLAELERLRTPAVLLGGPELQAPITNVLVDNAEGARAAVRALADLGHRDIARVSGPRDMVHCQARDEAFIATCAEREVSGQVIEGDYSEGSGREATRQLLTGSRVPSAVVYDNDLMAIGGLTVAKELGARVPDELSVIAWDDTAVARLAHPPLSVVTVDVHGLGTIVGEAILAVMDGAGVTTYQVPKPTIRLAQSTAAMSRELNGDEGTPANTCGQRRFPSAGHAVIFSGHWVKWGLTYPVNTLEAQHTFAIRERSQLRPVPGSFHHAAQCPLSPPCSAACL